MIYEKNYCMQPVSLTIHYRFMNESIVVVKSVFMIVVVDAVDVGTEVFHIVG